MKAVIAVVTASIVMLLSPAAKAWNCPSGQIRVQAPAGTPTNTPYYDVVEGIAFICAPADPQAGSTNTNTNSNTNVNQNSNNNSSSSKSTSSSNATGGTGIGIGGSVSNSGNSNVKNSVTVDPKITTTVDPKITSTNEQEQQQAQKQSQSQSIKNSGNSSSNSSANGNGNNSNNYTENVPRTVASAVAPTVFPSAPCFKGFSGGGQGLLFGASFGSGKIDENCARLEVARSFLVAGNHLAYCKLMLTNKYVQQAGVSLEDCLGPAPVAVVEAPAPVAVQAPSVTVNVPAIPVIMTVLADPAPVEQPNIVVAAKKVHQRHPIKPCPEPITNDTLPAQK